MDDHEKSDRVGLSEVIREALLGESEANAMATSDDRSVTVNGSGNIVGKNIFYIIMGQNTSCTES